MKKSAPFTDEQLIKIDANASVFLARCESGTPLSSLTWFIEDLKADPSWTSEEIIELQTMVIRLLVYRHRLTEQKPESN